MRYGACVATDMITVEGHRVGFMYREKADDAVDSGWRFLSGHESQEYMDDAENHAVYDINTIANYDPEIIPSSSQRLVQLSSAIQHPVNFVLQSSRHMTTSTSRRIVLMIKNLLRHA